MRLRSSQFVFLLLLACSVNLGEDYAVHLLASSVSSSMLGTSHLRESSAQVSKQHQAFKPSTARLVSSIALDQAARAAHRTVWTMPSPALHSAAITSFTGFLRA